MRLRNKRKKGKLTPEEESALIQSRKVKKEERIVLLHQRRKSGLPERVSGILRHGIDLFSRKGQVIGEVVKGSQVVARLRDLRPRLNDWGYVVMVRHEGKPLQVRDVLSLDHVRHLIVE